MTPEQREASKAQVREERRTEAKAKYAEAQVPEELRDLF